MRATAPPPQPGSRSTRVRLLRWRRRRRSRALPAAVLAALFLVPVLSGCTPPGLPEPLDPPAIPTEPTTTASAESGTEEAEPPIPRLVLGVDGTVTGFHPYVQAQYSPVGQAIGDLVLPGVFPTGTTDPAVEPTPLVERAEVTLLDPFTVTYTLAEGTTWSDGTPIAAEDFSYLWQQMISQPGLSGSGGYRLISQIRSRNAGKTVEVEFSGRYLDWRTLFSPLLPGRLLKGDPAGFAGALTTGLPVSGGPYKMDSFDPITGEIALVRNDKYWGTEPGIAEVTIRIGTAAELAAALDRQDVDAVLLQPDAEVAAALRRNHPGSVGEIAVPAVQTLSVTESGRAGVLADPAVRRALALAVDRRALAAVWSGGRADGVQAVGEQLGPPAADADWRALPPRGSAEEAFTAAGFQRTGLYQQREGITLRVVVGYLVGDPAQVAAARELQKQWGRAGILVDLLGSTTADRLVPDPEAPAADVELGLLPRDASPAGDAVAAFNCAVGEGLDDASGVLECLDVDTGELSPEIAEAVATVAAGGTGLSDLDEQLWSVLFRVPIGRPVGMLATGPRVAGVPSDGVESPLARLPQWQIVE